MFVEPHFRARGLVSVEPTELEAVLAPAVDTTSASLRDGEARPDL